MPRTFGPAPPPLAGAGLGGWQEGSGVTKTSTVADLSSEGMINVYDRILVAVDYSDSSERVLAAARDLALLSKGEVWVLHLMERKFGGKVGVVTSNETYGEAEGAVATSVKVLADAGVVAYGEVRTTLFGHAADEIIDGGREHHVDVIVMGSHGHGDLAGLLLGNTAHKVIHLADRPVLVVR